MSKIVALLRLNTLETGNKTSIKPDYEPHSDPLPVHLTGKISRVFRYIRVAENVSDVDGNCPTCMQIQIFFRPKFDGSEIFTGIVHI